MTDKVAVIAGGGSALGTELVRTLTSMNWTLYVLDRNAELARRSVNVTHIPCDLLDSQSIRTACDDLMQRETGVDLVIYDVFTPSIYGDPHHPFGLSAEQSQKRAFSAMDFAMCLGPVVRTAGGTHLVMPSFCAGDLRNPSMTGRAVSEFFNSLRKSERQKGATVFVSHGCPVSARIPFLRRMVSSTTTAQWRDHLLANYFSGKRSVRFGLMTLLGRPAHRIVSGYSPSGHPG